MGNNGQWTMDKVRETNINTMEGVVVVVVVVVDEVHHHIYRSDRDPLHPPNIPALLLHSPTRLQYLFLMARVG